MNESLSEKQAMEYLMRSPARVIPVATSSGGIQRSTAVCDFLPEAEHYSASFGFQWTKYRNVQIDRFNGTKASYLHLLAFAQGDTSVFKGTTCLEIGSGAGRFTDYLVELCETVITVDASPAIFSNAALGASNLIPCRADLFEVPVIRDKVDIVFCRGVIQHTAAPLKAIERLFDYVRPGGLVLFDVYPLKWYTPFLTKYWLRPFTRNIEPDRFVRWAEKWVPKLLRFKRDVLNRLFPNTVIGINISNQLMPIADYTRSTELRSWAQQIQWSVLDTVDMYTPRYDKPMTFSSIIRLLQQLGAKGIRANRSTFCFRAIAP